MSEILNIIKERDESNNKNQQKIKDNNNNTYGDNPTKAEEQNNNQNSKTKNFLRIDGKNIFEVFNDDDITNIKLCYDKFTQSEDDIVNNSINKIMNKLLEKICYSNYNNDIFTISQNLIKQFCKNNRVSTDKIDDVINYLMGNNINAKNAYKSQSLLLTKNRCEIIGCILCYSYSKLNQYKIKDINKLIELRKTIIEKGIDVVRDFSHYCKKNKDTDQKITSFWKNNKNNYDFVPELIFLINRYSNVTEVEIDFNLFDESFNEDISQIQLIEITLLNINWLFNSLNSYKINFINESLQQSLFLHWTEKLNQFNSDINENIKKDLIIKDTEKIYKKKCDFMKFIQLDYNQLVNKDNSNIKLKRKKSGDLSCLFTKTKTFAISQVKRKTKEFLSDNFFQNEFTSIIKFRTSKSKEDNEKENYNNKMTTYSGFFELIIICLFSLYNTDNPFEIELIMNDSYMEEFLSYFKYLGVEIDEIQDIFNIFDILVYNNKKNFINKLKIEINSLDFITFDRLLNILYNNNKVINSINMSFFSSDITYSTQFLYKICKGPINDSILKDVNDDSDIKVLDNTADIEEIILRNIYTYYIYYFSVLFDIFQNMENLDEICLYFDIPDNIKNKSNYMMVIIKFILNNLFYYLNDIKIKKIWILSPNTIFDKRQFPIIDKIIKNININKNSLLTDLSLHFQFYQISNIKNFISTRLEILSIGDLDLKTFKSLCDIICTPYFNINSSLTKLSIGLLNNLVDFNTEMKFLLRRIFNIKIRNFISLSLYTNLLIEDELDYDYFIQILNNNWISEYTIILNNKSKENMIKFTEDAKKLVFYVPHNLETELLKPNDIIPFQNHSMYLEIDKNKDYYDDSYWYLKYLFEHVFTDKMKNEKRTKNMIMGILKYLYFIKTPTINGPTSKEE